MPCFSGIFGYICGGSGLRCSKIDERGIPIKYSLIIGFALISVVGSAQQHPQSEPIGWHRKNSGTDENLLRIQFFSLTNGWICAESPNAYHTIDGGDTWTKYSPPENFRYAYFLDDSTAIAVGTTPDGVHSRVMTTTDRGQTWSEEYQDDDYSNAGDILHSNDTVIVLHEAFIFRSLDRGLTWKKFEFTEFSYMEAIASRDATKLIIVGRSSVVAGSGNGGEDFGQITTTGLEDDIHFNDVTVLPNGRIIIIGSSRTIIYTDDYEHWTSIPKLDEVKATYLGVSFADSKNGLVVGSEGTILRTVDSGKTWNLQNSHIKYPEDTSVNLFLRSVLMIDSLNAWVGGEDGILLHTTDAGKSWVRQYLPSSLHSQVNPQPFVSKTTISYELPKAARVVIRIYDALGKELEQITGGTQDAGAHAIEFDGSGYSNEVFYYRIEAGPYTGTGKFSKMQF